MKLPSSNISTETVGMRSEISFGVGDMGLIFDILRNKLYKNPITAICREISCNARDAHREFGTPERPIVIQLPNTFSPEYKVKDFGPGITPERMENIFCKYAASTKREDNSQLGAYGIGAKSPFSYTDTFNIISITNNIKRIYTAYIDETKIGKIALSSEETCSEENGTTIVIPISKKDMPEFIQATIETTKYWKVKPILTGINPAPVYPEETVLFFGEKWEAIGTNRYNRLKLAIIDGIPYEINKPECYNYHDSNLQYMFKVQFEIGELSLSASRDSIHYDDKTVNLIKDRFSTMSVEILKRIEEKIQNCSTYLEACKSYQLISSENGYGLQTLNLCWRGKKVVSEISIIKIGKWSKLFRFEIDSKRTEINRVLGKNYILNFDPTSKIYHNDCTNENINKEIVKYLFTLNPNTKSIQIISTPKAPSAGAYHKLVRENKNPIVEYDLELMDFLEVEKLSSIDLPKIPKKPRQSRPKIKNTNKIHVYQLQSNSSKITVKSIVVEDNGGIYLEFDKNKRCTSGNLTINSNNDLKLIAKYLEKDIYAFTPFQATKLSKHWIKLEDVLIEKNNSYNNLAQLQLDILASIWLPEKQFSYLDKNYFKSLLKSIDNKDNLILLYVKEADRISMELKNNETLISILSIMDPHFENKIKLKTDETLLHSLLIRIKKEYPLFDYLADRYSSEKHFIELIDYINLVDEHSTMKKLFDLQKVGT